MLRFVPALLSLFACLPLAADDADAQGKFIGTWEAQFKGKVICTIRLTAGEPISGETADCSIQVDENGDLRDSDSAEHPDGPSPVLNAIIRGDTLTFEEQDGDDVLKFEMRVISGGHAELRILNSPVPIKPIQFTKK